MVWITGIYNRFKEKAFELVFEDLKLCRDTKQNEEVKNFAQLYYTSSNLTLKQNFVECHCCLWHSFSHDPRAQSAFSGIETE